MAIVLEQVIAVELPQAVELPPAVEQASRAKRTAAPAGRSHEKRPIS